MPSEKTTGVVLKVVEFSETSCVVTLYTRDFGKITALAKGARRLRSPFEGAIDLLATCRIVFLRKSLDKLDLMTEAKLLRRFRSASTDLSRFYAGLYVIELVLALTDHADPQPELFDLVERTIEEIDSSKQSPVALQLLQFQMELLKLLGNQPSLNECVECGLPVETAIESGRVAFGMLAGGVYCPQCRGGKRSVVGLRGETLQLMQQLSQDNIAIESLSTNRAIRGELGGLLEQYMADLIGFRPKMQAWLKHVFRE